MGWVVILPFFVRYMFNYPILTLKINFPTKCGSMGGLPVKRSRRRRSFY